MALPPDPKPGGKTDPGSWPQPLQFALAIVVVFVIAGLILFPPVYTSRLLVDAGIDTSGAMSIWAPMLAVLIGLTTVTISGIFLFMTFRIDRGTKRVAREEAAKTAEKEARDEAAKVAEELRVCISKDRECAEREISGLREKVKCKLSQLQEVDQLATRAKQASDCVETSKVKAKRAASDVQGELENAKEQAGELEALLKSASDRLGDDKLQALIDRVDKLERRLWWLPAWTLRKPANLEDSPGNG